MSEDRKKFRRILVVAQNRIPPEWQETLDRYADEVTLVACDNFAASDYLHSMPADCMITDCRVPDYDLMSIGMCVTLAERRLLPRLEFYDDRPQFNDLKENMLNGAHCVRFGADAIERIVSFLEETEPFSFDSPYVQPWQVRPWTVSIEELRQAGFSFEIIAE